jgi:hypothetical protein
MKSHCINCGAVYEDPLPGMLMTMVATGATIEQITSAIHTNPYCPACTREAARLAKSAHQMMLALNHQNDRAFKEFGY